MRPLQGIYSAAQTPNAFWRLGDVLEEPSPMEPDVVGDYGN